MKRVDLRLKESKEILCSLMGNILMSTIWQKYMNKKLKKVVY